MTKSAIWTDLDLEREGASFGYFRLPISTHERDVAFIPIPVGVFKNGPGPRILILGGVHGDEYEGQVLAMKLMRTLDIDNVRGHIIILPAANAPAAYAGRRTSAFDEINLNRAFPGDAAGAPTQQVAHFIETVLLARSDYLIDIHSGGDNDRHAPSAHIYRPRDDAKLKTLLAMLQTFAMPVSVVIEEENHGGKIAGACDRTGVLRIATELGGGGGVDIDALAAAERGLHRILFALNALKAPMTDEAPAPGDLVARLHPRAIIYAMATGVFEPFVKLGDVVEAGQAGGAIHFPEEPWRDPWIAEFKEGGTVYCVRARARTQMGDMLFMLTAPWRPSAAIGERS